jgi:hypothetical protein
VPDSEPSREATLHEIVEALRSDIETNLTSEKTEVLEARQSACALCRLITRSVERSLRALFAEFVNDPPVRARLRRAQGFCAVHTPLLAALGDSLAVAILYNDLAEATRTRWQAEAAAGGRRGLRVGGRRQTPKPPSAPCPACAAEREAEARYTGALAAGLGSADIWTALESGDGLCVAHAGQVMARAKPALAARLRQLETARLAALQAELQAIIRKNDYRFRGEPWGAEKDAWRRALRKITRP